MYVWCNDDCAKSLKTKPDAISGKSDYNFYSKKEAEKKIADEKKVMEKGKVFETDKKIETNKGTSWIKEILIPLWDGSSDASGILGITWDYTSEKICDLEKGKMQKEIENVVSTLSPVFSNLSQGNLDEKIKVSEEVSNFTELYNTGNSALDSLKQSQEELQNQINQKNEELEVGKGELNKTISELEQEREKNNQKNKELETNKAELNRTQNELEQEIGIINQKNEELEANKAELNRIQSELDQEKEKNNQKEQESEQEKQKVNEANNQLEENKRKHKEFIVNMLQDLEEKMKSVNSE